MRKRAKKDSKEVNKGGTRRVQKVWKNGEGGESVKKVKKWMKK